jgi:uroporphyrinogen decarboxylase
MALKLNGQQRVNRMFARQDQDRIPRHESFWAETIRRFQDEGLIGDAQTVLEMLGSDFGSLCWCWPQAFPGEWQLISEDHETKIVRETNGRIARYWKNKSGTPEHLGFDCDSREKWETVFKPALLKNWLQVDPIGIRKNYAKHREQGKWSHLTGVESFEETRQIIGDEVVLMAMAEDPEWVIDISRTFTNVLIRNLDVALQTGVEPDGLWIYGDMAFKTATMCSPAMYKELIWPDHKRIADWAHQHGMKFIFHTDGDVNGVMDLYIAAGFDCVQPLEAKASMDVRKLCPKYGQKLAFFGNIDVMKMATNDLDLIEEEIRSKLAAGMATKGYAYHSDHSVPPQVSWKTYQAIIEMVKRYGSYE